MSKRKRRRGLRRGQIIGLAAACIGIAAVIGAFVILMSKNNGDKDGSVDIDLSVMNATEAFLKLQDMTQKNPDAFLGQTVRAEGRYGTQVIEGTMYYYCSFAGGDGCCPNGLEFKYSGKKPSGGQMIEIVGKYSKYTDKNDNSVYYVDVTELTRV